MTTEDWKNKLYFGDNLDILRNDIAEASVDLIYLDPPFNSNANYNVLFQEKSGQQSAAQITAFKDTWHWDKETARTYENFITNAPSYAPNKLLELLKAMRSFIGDNDMMAYLTMMAQRMVELYRVLKDTGSIYLHCDPTASHYLKLLMDSVFGAENFRNEITWKRTGAHNSANRYGPVHDIILFYTKGNGYLWNQIYLANDEYIANRYTYTDEQGRRFYPVSLLAAGTRGGASGMPWRGIDVTAKGNHWRYTIERLEELDAAGDIYWPTKGTMPRLKMYANNAKGELLQDWWGDISPINSQGRERLGYPTQKPEALLERIISASSNEEEVVLDPFCGCGTAVAAAERLNRRWIGIDITHLAVTLIRHRLRNTYTGQHSDDLKPYEVIGQPQDVASAQALAVDSENSGRYQFELWALSLVEARPAHDGKKGADSGIDGYINFFDDNSGKAKRIVVQVKSGHVTRNQIATLKGDMEREKAEIGLFITLQKPTRPMEAEAASAGFYTSEPMPNAPMAHYLRVQILTIEELLTGAARAEYPRLAPEATFRRAQRRRRSTGTQSHLV